MHRELEKIIRSILTEVLAKKFTDWFDKRIIFHVVEDKEERQILDYRVKFLDIHGQKDRQFGFKTQLAFCMESEADMFKPYEKMHSTAENAGKIAASLDVGSLILYHGSDNDLTHRKENYRKEASKHFHGNIYVPDDLDVIAL